MRRCTFISILLTFALLMTGCGRWPQLGGKLQAAGGATALKQECATFLQRHEKSNGQEYVWMGGRTNFPPTIAAFRPQLVRITRMGDVELVEVQVTGGFDHHGLFVAPTPVPPGFRPSRRHWRVWQLADGVWEYRE